MTDPGLQRADRRSEIGAVLAMSVPNVVTMCSPLAMRIADFAFVSQLGTIAQAAILPAQIIIWSYMALSVGTVSAVNTFAAQSLGRRRLRDCSAFAWQGFYLSVVFGIVGLGLWFLFPGVFSWIGHEPQVQNLEVIYTRISVWAIFPTVAAQALGSFFNGIHRPRVTMVAAVESNALNIVLSYALIFGAWDLPKLGFAGAAWGTVIASIYNMIRLLVVMGFPGFDRQFATRRTLRFDAVKIRVLLRVGLPQGLHWLSDVTVWALFTTRLIGQFGTVQLAASNVAWQYIRISFMPMLGVGQAVTALVGHALGQSDPQKAIRLTRIGVGVTLVYILTLSLVYALKRDGLISLFSSNAKVLEIGGAIMICLAIFQIFDVFGTIYYHALRGAGDTVWPMIVLVIGHWSVVVGGGWLISTLFPQFGAMGPWIVATILISTVGLLLWWRWHSGAWMNIDLFSHDVASQGPIDLDVRSDSVTTAPSGPTAS